MDSSEFTMCITENAGDKLGNRFTRSDFHQKTSAEGKVRGGWLPMGNREQLARRHGYCGDRFSWFCWGGASLSIIQGAVKGNLTTIQRDRLARAYPTNVKRIASTTDSECHCAGLAFSFHGKVD